MTQYTVQPGDSPASVAGKLYGDQRRYVDLINANGGSWHPGDVIDIPDITGTPSPVITQAQFNAAPTGYKNGQAQYRSTTSTSNAPATPTFSQPAVPTFSNAHGTSSNGASPWAVQPPTTTPAASQHTTSNTPINPYSVGAYDSRTGRNAGVTGAGPGAQPTGQRGAGTPASGPGFNAAINTPAKNGQRPTPTYEKARNYFVDGENPALRAWSTQGNSPSPAPSKTQVGGNATQTAMANGVDVGAGYQALANAMKPTGYAAFEQGAPGPATTVPPEMANVAYAARYSTAAIYAYGGLYGPAWKGNRQTLPVVLYPRVANEIPIPAGFKDTPSFMAALGYAVDASGNYIRKDPMVSQGYGGGGNNYGTATALPASYGYGGYGYGGYGSSGTAAQAPGGAGAGLVNWRVTA